MNHHYRVVKKHRFPKLLQEARHGACTKENAVSGWGKTGLYPFKPAKILKTLRIPSDVQLDFELSESETYGSEKEFSPQESPGPAQQVHDALKYQAPLPITRFADICYSK